ncbi:alkaline phosphatase [Cruoricaptor ignavus]|uniref:Alkaline phosphatase n=1 Tax=Cruoricaptor ignavus TaxID=1118202 RepID=A0A7M1T5S5_9FLAO|nr:alkaline phosphatase [Cruoricaptor ignavus]QOR74474.1 alkaline phosphatase [Cruoricaptor ignavus]
MKKLFFFIFLVSGFCAEFSAQNFSDYSVRNAHSHNDYHQPIPFWTAYYAGFGSIEADVFYQNNQLLIGHDPHELTSDRTLEKLYLEPIAVLLRENNGSIRADKMEKLILFIEMKSDYRSELPALVRLLDSKYQIITQNKTVKLIITGNVPQPSEFKNYPEYLFFDGDLTKEYSPDQLGRVGMFSAPLRDYTKWNGKGIMRDEESAKVREAVRQAHLQGKAIRFWGAPDFANAWVNLMDAGADFINTDKIPELAAFLNQIPKNEYRSHTSFEAYHPKFPKFKTRAKNVVLMIADGVALPQLYAAYTANRGSLNIFRMPYTGISKTNSANAFVTDSAPGSTAFSSGVKTNNNFVGVDPQGKPLRLLPEILKEKGIVSGLISTGDVTDATPADFYAHTDNRDDSRAILQQFADSGVKILAGAPAVELSEAEREKFKSQKINIFSNSEIADFQRERALIMDPLASKNFAERGNWLINTLEKTLKVLSRNKKGFFIMAEASRTDINLHSNEFGKMVDELLDFDEAVGRAMRFADENRETLVIVIGDHETGGVTLLDGDLKTGRIFAQQSTNDHTALPVSVFAYGSGAERFVGFYENTAVFYKILNALNIKP